MEKDGVTYVDVGGIVGCTKVLFEAPVEGFERYEDGAYSVEIRLDNEGYCIWLIRGATLWSSITSRQMYVIVRYLPHPAFPIELRKSCVHDLVFSEFKEAYRGIEGEDFIRSVTESVVDPIVTDSFFRLR